MALARALTNAQAPQALVSAAAATERQAKFAKGQALDDVCSRTLTYADLC